MTARTLLGPGGPLSQALSGYEHRPGQLDMATAVERALGEDRILLCEAGTGTGKTLAYLIPAIESGRRVVISTASRALQEQIVHKDVPLVMRLTGLTGDVVMVKGLANYLCLRRFAELEREVALGSARAEVARALPLVREWAAGTDTGDISELADLPESHPVWSLVASSSDTRIGPRCRHFDACHVTRLKQKAERAMILVVNHHLFFADLALKGDHPGGALPAYDAVILDEAHRIEDVASQFFGARFSSSGATRMFADCARAFRAAGLEAPERLLATAASELERLMAALNLEASSRDGRVSLGRWSGALQARWHALDESLDALEKYVADATSSASLAHAATRIQRQREALATIAEPGPASVSYIERRDHGLALAATPVHVGQILRDKLMASGRAIVLTSASLTSLGSFSFVRYRLGLDEPLAAPVDELMVASPIEHQSQALLYAPLDLPEVTEAAFPDAAADRIGRLFEMSPGGAFVLCTSLQSMHALAAGLRARIQMLLVQGEAPKAALLDRFRAHGRAALVATMSFWEGVDVPGAALSLVVIDRLPFAVPTDPLVAARARALESEGRSPFREDALPRAAILLKQGVGRLLRTRRDYGVVGILDRRIRTRSYREPLLESLPELPLTGDLGDVERFWRIRREAEAAWS